MNTPSTKRTVIAYKVVQYIYGKKNDLGTLMSAFKDEQEAIEYKINAIQKTKFNKEVFIYMIEPVYEYFDFIAFLTQTV